MAPATKYGGKIVVCHPGSKDVAKSCSQWSDGSTSRRANPAQYQAYDFITRPGRDASRFQPRLQQKTVKIEKFLDFG